MIGAGDDVVKLSRAPVGVRVFPADAAADAAHVAIAAVNGVDYLGTRNMKHLVNPATRFGRVGRDAGHERLVVRTPRQLL